MPPLHTLPKFGSARVKTIPLDVWREKERHGYTSIIEGQRYVLTYSVVHGTTLEPVEVEPEPDCTESENSPAEDTPIR